MTRDISRASFNITFVLNGNVLQKIERAARNAARSCDWRAAPCASDDAESPFIQGNIKGKRALTISAFKSLDYVNSPQSKQNVSQFEPADVVFSTFKQFQAWETERNARAQIQSKQK
jgi:hypothetical protein